jgi:hypothetical protein
VVVLVRVLAVVVAVLLEVDAAFVVVAVAVIVLDCGLWVYTRGIHNAMINVAEQIHATADKKTCGYTVVLYPASIIKCPTP